MSKQITYLNHSKSQNNSKQPNKPMYPAGWPSGLRRQIQEMFSIEISGTQMCSWVQIPLLSEVFEHCEVSHELNIMQNQKQFCF